MSNDPQAAKEVLIRRIRGEYEKFNGREPDAKAARAIEEQARRIAEGAPMKNREYGYRPRQSRR